MDVQGSKIYYRNSIQIVNVPSTSYLPFPIHQSSFLFRRTRPALRIPFILPVLFSKVYDCFFLCFPQCIFSESCFSIVLSSYAGITELRKGGGLRCLAGFPAETKYYRSTYIYAGPAYLCNPRRPCAASRAGNGKSVPLLLITQPRDSSFTSRSRVLKWFSILGGSHRFRYYRRCAS